MNRRDFILSSAAALASGALCSCASTPRRERLPIKDTRTLLQDRFRTILSGFLRNARATSADYTACDFPGGTMLRSCCTPNGKTFTSVARMLPAIAEFVVADPQAHLDGVKLSDVMLSIYRTAFDPAHPDYWGEPTGNKPTQRTVESSLVAIGLARLGPAFAGRFSSRERKNINRWLASCTVIPERTNNHAWFTAVNQATRLRLGRSLPEFKGDEEWMIEDLKAMDVLVLAAKAADGWYSDDPKLTVYDYYNFWTFGNFPLFWSRIAGDLYPDWNTKLRTRAREFLLSTPWFFAADGAVPLFGRSLLYRWSVLSPLVLAYEQRIWPHSPGLLRRILQKNFEWWWQMGAYDQRLGKLRETLSPGGTRDVSEGYIDNGHPYWAMLAFTFFSIPPRDPLWTAPEEPLPVEKADYQVKIPGPKMILVGTKASGQVRWIQAQNTPRRDYYRDKYNKFASSSSFPFNVIQNDKAKAPWDQTLVFRDFSNGACVWRVFPESGELLQDGVRTTWSAMISGHKAQVVSTIRLSGEFEYRDHSVSFDPETGGDGSELLAIEMLEGSYPLGLAESEVFEKHRGPDWMAIRSKRSDNLLVSWIVRGHQGIEVLETFGPERVNLVYPRMAVISLSGKIDLAKVQTRRLTSLHYGSPKPFGMDILQKRARKLMQAWK